jgi:hypothetical protein
LGLLLDGRHITSIRVDDAKKQGYWGSAAFFWWAFWALLLDRMVVRPWDYFNQARLRNGSLQSDQPGLLVCC